MRILFLTSQLRVGGAERQLVRTAAHLAALDDGLEVLVLSGRPGLEAVAAERPPPRPNLRFGALDVADRRQRVAALRRTVREAEPDVVVGWLKASWIWSATLAGGRGQPVLRLAERNALDGYGAGWRAAKLVVARRAERIVANSVEAAAQWCAARPGADVRAAGNFPPPSRLLPVRTGGERPRLVFVGRLEPVKGLDVALDALAVARSAGAEVELVVVGRDDTGGAAGQELQRRAEQAGVADLVEWRPPSTTWLDDLGGQIDGVLLPSRSEGSSNVLAEALAAGLPVLATTGVHPPRPGITYAQARAGDPGDLGRLLVEQAWTATEVAPGTFERWSVEAGREAEAAWL